MKDDRLPAMRRDLDFFPLQHGGKQYVLIKDPLGLVQEGKAIELPVFQLMMLLDGNLGIRDLQMALMRQKGGVLVGSDEVKSLLTHLDQSFLLDSEKFRNMRDQIVEGFISMSTRPCSHCGRAYPLDPLELRKKLDQILGSTPNVSRPEGKIMALVSPHIDLSVGFRSYASTYQLLRHASPSRVVLLGTGHHQAGDLFCLTDKDFDTPIGTARCDKEAVGRLKKKGKGLLAPNDFVHRTEHSIEFQVLFLKHLLKEDSFRIIPILCGSLLSSIPEYSREAYQKKAEPFLSALKEMLAERNGDTLLVAGVDFSHIGPKFGHETPARHLQRESEKHDRNLLDALSTLNAGAYWNESGRVKDQYNVCGFGALACLLEVLPSCKGQVLHYEMWHEEPTQSAVSFASMVFTKPS